MTTPETQIYRVVVGFSMLALACTSEQYEQHEVLVEAPGKLAEQEPEAVEEPVEEPAPASLEARVEVRWLEPTQIPMDPARWRWSSATHRLAVALGDECGVWPSSGGRGMVWRGRASASTPCEAWPALVSTRLADLPTIPEYERGELRLERDPIVKAWVTPDGVLYYVRTRGGLVHRLSFGPDGRVDRWTLREKGPNEWLAHTAQHPFTPKQALRRAEWIGGATALWIDHSFTDYGSGFVRTLQPHVAMHGFKARTLTLSEPFEGATRQPPRVWRPLRGQSYVEYEVPRSDAAGDVARAIKGPLPPQCNVLDEWTQFEPSRSVWLIECRVRGSNFALVDAGLPYGFLAQLGLSRLEDDETLERDFITLPGASTKDVAWVLDVDGRLAWWQRDVGLSVLAVEGVLTLDDGGALPPTRVLPSVGGLRRAVLDAELGRALIVENGRLRVLWLDNLERIDLPVAPDELLSAAFSPDGRHLALADAAAIHVVDLAHPERELAWAAAKVHRLAYRQDGGRLFGAVHGELPEQAWEPTSGAEVEIEVELRARWSTTMLDPSWRWGVELVPLGYRIVRLLDGERLEITILPSDDNPPKAVASNGWYNDAEAAKYYDIACSGGPETAVRSLRDFPELQRPDLVEAFFAGAPLPILTMEASRCLGTR